MVERDAMRVALHAVCSLRSVYRWMADPASVRGTTRLRIERAISELGIALEPRMRQAA
ncbi:MAG: hypothetical protein JW940_02720 [Polyangiaceae bacterium]|nr:hypothetical protein [Polyangiaceae bacterium]